MHKTTYWEKYNSFKKIVHFFFSLNTWFSCHCVTNIIEAFWFGLHLTSSFTLADENLHIVRITRNEVRKSVSLPTTEMYGNPQYNCCFFFFITRQVRMPVWRLVASLSGRTQQSQALAMLLKPLRDLKPLASKVVPKMEIVVITWSVVVMDRTVASPVRSQTNSAKVSAQISPLFCKWWTIVIWFRRESYIDSIW